MAILFGSLDFSFDGEGEAVRAQKLDPLCRGVSARPEEPAAAPTSIAPLEWPFVSEA
jgi:hypothetical protein